MLLIVHRSNQEARNMAESLLNGIIKKMDKME